MKPHPRQSLRTRDRVPKIQATPIPPDTQRLPGPWGPPGNIQFFPSTPNIPPTSREEQDRHSQLLQQLELALYLGRPVRVIPKAVDEDLQVTKKHQRTPGLVQSQVTARLNSNENSKSRNYWKQGSLGGSLEAGRKGQGWKKSVQTLLVSPSTWICSRYCCCASYSRCWFFSRSSLVFMKFSKSPR